MGKVERITELEQNLAEANFTIQSLQEEVSDYKKAVSHFPQVKADYDEKVNALTSTHKKEMEDAKNLLVATEKSVNRRVTEALASMGVTMFVPEELISVNGPNPSDLYQKFLTLKGVEQTEFYRKHEKELSRFLSAK